eukprot:327954_1
MASVFISEGVSLLSNEDEGEDGSSTDGFNDDGSVGLFAIAIGNGLLVVISSCSSYKSRCGSVNGNFEYSKCINAIYIISIYKLLHDDVVVMPGGNGYMVNRYIKFS